MFKFAFALAALAVAAPTFAQDAAPIGEPLNFNGPYAGIQGGWQQDRQTLRVEDTGLSSRASNKNDGFAYGGQIGYDAHLTPNIVLGAEVAITGRTGRGDFDGDFTLSQGRTISATGRLGYQLDPASLLYARGGYANAQYRIDDGVNRTSEDRDGFQVGGGYERMLTRRVSARLEYAYSKFGSDDLPFVAASLGADRARLDYERHAVTAGVNFRF